MAGTKAKRSNGEGSIYRRKRDGKWIGELTTGYECLPDGKRKRLFVRCIRDKHDEVRKWLTEQLTDRDNGIVVVASKDSLGVWLDTWLKTIAKPKVKPGTFIFYEKTIKYLAPIAGTPLQKLSPQQVQMLYYDLHKRVSPRTKQTLSPRTIHHVHAVLHKALEVAKRQGKVKINASDHVEVPSVPRKEMKTLSPDEVLRFLDVAKTDRRLYPLYLLLVQVGLRIGEALGLRWQDVDLDKKTITIRQTLNYHGGKLWFGTPKSQSSRRTIDLPPNIVKALQEWATVQADERSKLGDSWQHPELVFTTTIGTPINPENIRNQSFASLLRKAGISHIRIHDLRHTAITIMGYLGIGPKEAQEMAGHSNISTTLGTYSHVWRETKKKTAQTLDAFYAANTEVH